MEAALAAAAVKRQQKKAAEIEAAAKRTEEERVKKNVRDHHQEEQETDWLDPEKKERIAAAAAKTEEEREERIKRVSVAGADQQDAEWLDKEKQERIQESFAQLEEERKNKRTLTAAVTAEQEAEWLDKEKQERIQAAAQRAEEERLAKLHRENEEAHKWKKPPNLGLGKGPKPPAFQTAQGFDARSSHLQPRSGHGASYGGVPQIPRGEIVQDHLLRPKDVVGAGTIRKFEPSTAPVDHKPTTGEASSAGRQNQPIEGVTQDDLKKYARELNPEPSGTEEHVPTNDFAADTPRVPEDVVVSTEVKEGVKVTTTRTVTFSTERIPIEKSPPPPKGCCIIL